MATFEYLHGRVKASLPYRANINDPRPEWAPEFCNFKTLFSFRTSGPEADPDLNGNPFELRLPENRTNLEIDLKEGYDLATLIQRNAKDGSMDLRVYQGIYGNNDDDVTLLDPHVRTFYRLLMEKDYFEDTHMVPDFVCQAGEISTLLRAVFEWNLDGHFLVARAANGAIFLRYINSPKAKKLELKREAQRRRKSSSSGHGTGSEPPGDSLAETLISDISPPPPTYHGIRFLHEVTSRKEVLSHVDDEVKFYRVYEAAFSGYKLLMLSKQLDAVQECEERDRPDDAAGDEDKDDNWSNVEVTVSPEQPRRSESSNFLKNYKQLRLWTDGVASDIKHNVIGFRSKSGILHEIQTIRTDDIPRLARKIRESDLNPGRDRTRIWEPEICLARLVTLLTFLKEHLIGYDPGEVYALSLEEKDRTARLFHTPLNRFCFLPADFVDHLNERR